MIQKRFKPLLQGGGHLPRRCTLSLDSHGRRHVGGP